MNARGVGLVAVLSVAGVFLPGLASAKCADPKTPVGAECRKYGEGWDGSAGWLSRVHLFAWLSARTLSYPLAGSATFDGNVESSPLAYHFPAGALGIAPLRSYGGETGIAWLPIPYVYIGLDAAFGEAHSSVPSFAANGLTIQPGAGLNVEHTVFGGVLGVRLPLGRVSFRADLLAAVSTISLDQYATNGTNQLTATGSATSLLLEPRLHADVWLSPFFTLGVSTGMPNADPSATNVGITFAAHTTAYDGRFAAF